MRRWLTGILLAGAVLVTIGETAPQAASPDGAPFSPDNQAAVAQARLMAERYPDNPFAHSGLGRALERAKQTREAMRAYEMAITLDAGHSIALARLALLTARAGNLEQAVRLFEQAVAAEPDNGEIWYNLGVTLGTLRRWSEAEKAYRQAVALKPQNADGWFNLGLVLLELKQPQEAKKVVSELETRDRSLAVKLRRKIR
jgi:Flp pilus assembly protein TadD